MIEWLMSMDLVEALRLMEQLLWAAIGAVVLYAVVWWLVVVWSARRQARRRAEWTGQRYWGR